MPGSEGGVSLRVNASTHVRLLPGKRRVAPTVSAKTFQG
jgi:hypothetical protein